jgi:hypothetical protein
VRNLKQRFKYGEANLAIWGENEWENINKYRELLLEQQNVEHELKRELKEKEIKLGQRNL